MAATGYNLNHLQVAPKAATPTYKDVNYAITFDPAIDQDSEKLQADGGNKVTAYGGRDGSGSMSFGSADLETIAVMTGDVYATTGVTPNIVKRLSIKDNTVPPSVILAAWIPNVDGNQTFKGMRIILPNANMSVPTTAFEQESWTEFEADVSFVGDANNTMLIWEELESAPTFTGGVMPAALT